MFVKPTNAIKVAIDSLGVGHCCGFTNLTE